ncbi:hypothetical protein DN069_22660 [Streptacidiphilus pinicola]|uniref:Uncharacterized protein n=1 Tax=Streptacidiphilus pinicola TaxID=2219663 RepID=A0A2X0IZI1_9ACTN|nr:hypothetical protein [Streptacidiphilus pinicola]RAG83326.1 hypothetical protein DN069_22660 [Streptacidiphilus pinicola]
MRAWVSRHEFLDAAVAGHVSDRAAGRADLAHGALTQFLGVLEFFPREIVSLASMEHTHDDLARAADQMEPPEP